jgi:hypothetical protein
VTSRQATRANARHRRADWRQEYLHLAVISMTICWLAPWVALTLGRFIDLSLSSALGLTAAHLLGCWLLVRQMIRRRANSMLILAAVIFCMGIAAGGSVLVLPSIARVYGGGERLTLADLFSIDEHSRVPAGSLVILWTLFLWWRAYQMSAIYATLVRASFGMRLGILSYLWVCVFADSPLRKDILALIPAFFFFGLLASSLARADSLNLDRAGRHSPFGRGWTAALFGIALLVTLSGYAAALWLTGINMEVIALALAIVIRGLLTLLFLLLTPVLYFIQLIIEAVRALFPNKSPATAPDSSPPSPAGNRDFNLPWLDDALRLVSQGLVVAVVIFTLFALIAFIWLAFVARARSQDDAREERESLGTGEVVGTLRQSLRGGWRRLAEALGVFRQFGLGHDLFVALTIRRIYARMEKLAGARGYPRAAAETPYEYRRELYQAFPGQNEDIHRITETYVAVRYGDLPEDPSELLAVRAAWERLHNSPDPTAPP